MSVEDEVSELLEMLASGHMTKATARELPERFSSQARSAAVARVAAQFAPPPPGAVLAGLELIAGETDRPVLVQTYLTNLRSPDPQARQVSLEGLARLDYPHVADLARGALRDGDDLVVASAVRALLPVASRDPALRSVLAGVAAQHADDEAFHLTNSLLSAHGIRPRDAP
jgi:hypothetical protein